MLNELREVRAQKGVPHRDFYNVRKVGLLYLYNYPLPVYHKTISVKLLLARAVKLCIHIKMF